MPKIYYWNYTFNYNGFIIPFIGIILNKQVKGAIGEDVLIRHELVHWNQFKRYGCILFLLLYIIDILLHGYDLSILEIEARYEELEWVKYNYTFAVRNGLAQSVHNPEFRKNKTIKFLNQYKQLETIK